MTEIIYDVIIVGGGPAGSTLAALLQKKGMNTVVLEKENFPRYHVGESLIPQVLDILEESEALPKIENHGFLRKEGGVFRWGESTKPWSFYFDEAAHRYKHQYAYQVLRSEFDDILLSHAKDLGSVIIEECTAKEFDYNSNTGIATIVANKGDEQVVIKGKLVADCTGQSTWMARKKRLLKFDPTLRNVALFTYYKGVVKMKGRDANGIFCEATPSGWLWNIPLHNGENSVGLVTRAPVSGNREDTYRHALDESVHLRRLLQDAKRTNTELRIVSDYSYTVSRMYGDGYILCGDAGGFVDPVWSTGVFLAVTSAKKAAEAISKTDMSTLAIQDYETEMSELLKAYREFIYFFYSRNGQPKDYFWKAYETVEGAVDERDAFIQLVSGRLKA
jgi:clorobiocin biosynthesis protein Clo-hal